MDTADNTAAIPAAEFLRELGLFEIDVTEGAVLVTQHRRASS